MSVNRQFQVGLLEILLFALKIGCINQEYQNPQQFILKMHPKRITTESGKLIELGYLPTQEIMIGQNNLGCIVFDAAYHALNQGLSP